MSGYTDFWNVYRKISKYSSIRNDEARFIQSSLLEIETKRTPLPDYLYDIGCGDGRVSSFLGTTRRFKNIFLIDSSESVNLAHNRLRSAGLNATAAMMDLDHGLQEIKQEAIVLAIGVINFFPDQYRILNQLIGNEPKFIFLAVTGFNIGGRIYRGLNIIRGSKAVSRLVGFLLRFMDQHIEHLEKRPAVIRNFFVFCLKLLEPLVASRIYRLKEEEYKQFFEQNNYRLLKEEELGLCRWYVFEKVPHG
jgi:hypothetical protein